MAMDDYTARDTVNSLEEQGGHQNHPRCAEDFESLWDGYEDHIWTAGQFVEFAERIAARCPHS